MIYYRCSCGEFRGYYSGMMPPDCIGCDICGTTLATSSLEHTPIQPHEYKTKPIPEADQPDATTTYCQKCFKNKKHIEKKTNSTK